MGVDEDEAEAVARWHCPGCIDLMSENPVMSKKGIQIFTLYTAWNSFYPFYELNPEGRLAEGEESEYERRRYYFSLGVFLDFFDFFLI